MTKEAKITGALPVLPAGMSLADPEVKQKYNESIEKVLASLENRSQIPWFKIAAALGDPGRTGSAGEAYGKAFGVLGQHQEEERARELPIAQMRAQLAGQQFQMSQEERAAQAFANVYGTTPDKLQGVLNNQQFNPMMMQRLNAAMPLLRGSPQFMELAKTMFGQHKDIANFILEQRKAGVPEAKLIAEYGQGVIPLLQSVGVPAPAGQPTTGRATTERPIAATSGAPAGRDPNLVYDDQGNVVDVRAQPDTTAPVRLQGQEIVRPQAGERPEPTIRTATEVMPTPKVYQDRIEFPDGRVYEQGNDSLGSWNTRKQSLMEAYERERAENIKFERDRISKAGELRDASMADRVKELGAINPDEISRTQGLLQSFSEIVKDPEMAGAFALMIKQGIGPALYELAKDSVRVGNSTVSVDAYNALIKQLPPKVQEKLRGSQMLLSELFIQKAREAKSAFGPQISNFDILMQKERMASIRDTPKLINNWITQELAMTDQKKEIAEAYSDFLKSASGTNKKPADFFGSEEYKALSKKYARIYKDLAIISYGAPK